MRLQPAIGRLALGYLLLLASPERTRSAENELSEADRAAGWTLLFDGHSTQGWRSFKKNSFPAKGWTAEQGWLRCTGEGAGDIITDAEFENFEFSWEWRLATNGNSGVKYFITETRNSAIGHEYQLIDDDRNEDARLRQGRRVTASLYDLIKPEGARPRPPEQANQSRLIVRGSHVEHWLNDRKVLEYECGSPALKDAVSGSKYKGVPGFGAKTKGHLLLQDHHCNVWFRNLKIRPIP
jgi:hypothetical protein